MSKAASRRRRVLAGVTLAVAAIVGWIAVQLGLEWSGLRREVAALAVESQTLTRQNDAVRQLAADIGPHWFEVCNRTQEDVLVVDWVSATYPTTEQTLARFDSTRCGEWEPVEIKPGKTHRFLLSSRSKECNWSGQVSFYALRFRRVSGDREQETYMAGPWLFAAESRGCFTVR